MDKLITKDNHDEENSAMTPPKKSAMNNTRLAKIKQPTKRRAHFELPHTQTRSSYILRLSNVTECEIAMCINHSEPEGGTNRIHETTTLVGKSTWGSALQSTGVCWRSRSVI